MMESTDSHSTHSSIEEKLPELVVSGSVMSCVYETNLEQKHPHCCKNEVLNDNAESDLRNPKTTAECPIVHNVSLETRNSDISSYTSCEGISFHEQQEDIIKFNNCCEQMLILPDEVIITNLDIDQGTVPEAYEPESKQSQSKICEKLVHKAEKLQMSGSNFQEQSNPTLKRIVMTASSKPPTELRNEEREADDSDSEFFPFVRPSRKGMRLNEESEFDAVPPTVRDSFAIFPPPVYPDIRISL